MTQNETRRRGGCADQKHSAHVYPAGSLNILSREEVSRLSDATQEVGDLLRRCALAVLNSGNLGDDAEAMLARFSDFSIRVAQVNRGMRLDLENAPGCAFVDGEMIRGIREQLSAVVRDIVYFHTEIRPNPYFDQETSEGLTNTVFEIARNAHLLDTGRDPNLVVCWGGHSIPGFEYDYTKEVGYQLGLRGVDICTGCGPGAMKGPMKGATIGHAKQRMLPGRYVGVTEPGIIAAESPNPIVNELVILPDIEKRLEAFVRLGHGVVVFPGGVGTAEEILFLLGVLLNPKNDAQPFPLVLTGPADSADYFEEIDAFVGLTLGDAARARYEIIIDDPERVATVMKAGLDRVREYRVETQDAFYYNWLLHIDEEFQRPFDPTHEAMAGLPVSRDLPRHQLAANLRRVFSGIVSGNVKADGIRRIREHGPFEIRGEPEIMQALDRLLNRFVRQHRMKLPGETAYEPCYRIVD
ncbi:LOG family protein [Wenzhouxiangella sp. XN79A]|uniref:nucleotide 5'-monophosphate nucleosidase PpnN n=1 Tax=Wenzhouxiangella sp. XN79A TaxID=2724193 RepID=UPI00144AFA11|nr:nucleotide 5'-monophosphate nucleosidase PpnN [Wenzhouxiangella sp. XN79A]NKI35905.1 LOG family protein [Wenzhouxiangella sp. XN79A]